MQLLVPQSEFTDFATLPDAVRAEVRAWMTSLAAVEPPIAAALERVARQMGVSARTARRKYDLAKEHGWRGLIDRAKAPERRLNGLHPATIEHWQKLVTMNQRAARPAYRALVRSFRAGELIPGVPADAPRDRLPEGWSYANLMRHMPTRFEITALRQGRSAARSVGPLVYTTRRDLFVGSHYVFDDLVHDHFVNVLGTAKTGRPVEFHALDLYSACKFAWGQRVRTESEITGRMEGLREENMRALVAQCLACHGYSERGTVMMVEHGTAAIREDLERLLYDVSGGRITVQRSGMEGDPAHIGQYAGRGRGNFRFKAALEVLGSLIHNELGMLPGQTGLSVERRPEETHGLLKHNDALVQAFVGLSQERPDLAAMLRFPVLSDRQFLEICLNVYGRINARTEHELEGWDLHVVPDESRPGRVRRMSPMEVWRQGHRALTRFRADQVAMVLYREALIVERTVSRAAIEFDDAELSADSVRFDCAAFRDGEKYGTLLNPFAPDLLFLFDARGRYVGVAPRLHRASRADADELRREFGRVNKVFTERLAPVARLGREVAEQRIADLRHNAEVLAAAQVKREARPEMRAARAGAAMAAATETLPADTEAPVTETESIDLTAPIHPAESVTEETVDLTGR